jgi:hypothetical protein
MSWFVKNLIADFYSLLANVLIQQQKFYSIQLNKAVAK